jgi:hypothetical protein
MFPNGSPFDSCLTKRLAGCHKETQTSNTTLKDTSTATVSGSSDNRDKASRQVFEFSELVQDTLHPNDITIIKDIFSEETHDHNNDTQSEDAKSNRYTYCREVIKPYLKDYPKDCPVSDDQLIRDALEAAQQDFPDYQPCFEIYKNDKDNLSKKESSKSCNISKACKDCSKTSVAGKKKVCTKNKPVVDKNDSSTSGPDKKKVCSKTSVPDRNEKKDSTKPSVCKKGKKDSPPRSTFLKDSSTSIVKSNMDSDQEGCAPKERDKRCPKKSHCPSAIQVCKEDKGKKPSIPSACQSKTQEGTSKCRSNSSDSDKSCKEKKPKAEGSKKEKEEDKACSQEMVINKINDCRKSLMGSSTIFNNDRPKTIIDAHNETMATIKLAVEDFFGKVYQTTKDAVCIIKSESAKQLTKITNKKSGGSCNKLPPHEVHDTKKSERFNFGFFGRTRNSEPAKNSAEEEGTSVSKTARTVIGSIFKKVGSTVSMVSDQVDLQKVTSIVKIRDFNNKSSEYDKPVGTENSKNGGGVFTAIKSKIVSMFSDEVKGSSSSSSTSSSNTATSYKGNSSTSVKQR